MERVKRNERGVEWGIGSVLWNFLSKNWHERDAYVGLRQESEAIKSRNELPMEYSMGGRSAWPATRRGACSDASLNGSRHTSRMLPWRIILFCAAELSYGRKKGQPCWSVESHLPQHWSSLSSMPVKEALHGSFCFLWGESEMAELNYTIGVVLCNKRDARQKSEVLCKIYQGSRSQHPLSNYRVSATMCRICHLTGAPALLAGLS